MPPVLRMHSGGRVYDRLMWDSELTRLNTHLSAVTHSIDNHQKQLYMENTFHDQARDRATQLYSDRIARENKGMFKRLMAVHTRKPREFITHHVQNPKTHSRFLEYQRVMEDNHRLVDRLLASRTFVNERGSWDDHALEHEETLLRLSHNPKNCFVPNLHSNRRRNQKLLREQSVAQQAAVRLQSKVLPQHAQQAAHLERVQALVDQHGIDIPNLVGDVVYPISPHRPPRYSYPLPPSTLPTDPSHPESARAHSSVLLPYGTHLVAPALLDQAQYDSLTQSLAGMDLAPPPPSSSHSARGRPRTFAMTGDLADANLTLPMPQPQSYAMEEAKEEHSEAAVFYLRPSRPRSPSPDGRNVPVAEAAQVPYPFRFPPLETREGAPLQSDDLASHRRGRSDHASPRSSTHEAPTHRAHSALPSTHPVDSFDPAAASRGVSNLRGLDQFSATVGPAQPPPPHGAQNQSARGRVALRKPAHLPAVVGSTQYQPSAPGSAPVVASSSSPSPSPAAFPRDPPSAFANSTSASSSSGPRGSRQSRRPQQRALEALLDHVFEAEANGTATTR